MRSEMARQRRVDAIPQRADHYETDAGRELRQWTAARVRAPRDQDAVADGGTVADSGREATVESAYTYHTEPPEQGGKAYVRCRDCQRELLVDLGGRARVLDDINIDIKRGETFAIVGESGSRKSTFGSILMDGVEEPGIASGEVLYYPNENPSPIDVWS